MIETFDQASKKISSIENTEYKTYLLDNSIYKEYDEKFLFFKPKQNAIIILFRENIDITEIEDLKVKLENSKYKRTSIFIITKSFEDIKIQNNKNVKILMLSTEEEKLSWPIVDIPEITIHKRLSYLLKTEFDDETLAKYFDEFFNVVAMVIKNNP